MHPQQVHQLPSPHIPPPWNPLLYQPQQPSPHPLLESHPFQPYLPNPHDRAFLGNVLASRSPDGLVVPGQEHQQSLPLLKDDEDEAPCGEMGYQKIPRNASEI